MLRAVWNGAVLAESGHTVKLEGNHYFPAESLRREYLSASPTTSTCPWKGQARYYHVTVNSKINRDAAWYYPHPSPRPGRSPGMSRSGAACGSSAFPARTGNRPGMRATARPAGSASGCTGRGHGREPGSRGTWRRAGVLATRMPALCIAAPGAARCPGIRHMGEHLGGPRRGGTGARHHRR